MLSGKEQDTTIAAHEALAPEPKEQPIQPMELLKWVFEQLAAIPWVACGAMGTGAGIALLYFYFASIDVVPADIPSILSASLLMAMLAFAFYMWVVVCLIAPLAGYRALDLHVEEGEGNKQAEKPGQAGTSGLWALQLIGVGGLLLLISVPKMIRCAPYVEHLLIAGTLFACVGAFGWWRNESTNAGRRRSWKKRMGLALLVSVAGALPFVVLTQLLSSHRGADWPHLVAFLSIWLTVVAVSAFLDRIPVWGCALMLTMLCPILMYSIPGLLGFPAFFPTTIAQLSGIRAEAPSELRVPYSTCRLIESAIGDSKTVKPVNCRSDNEWGTVHAQVLSNLGGRWLIEVQLDGPQPKGRNGAVRVTIPGEGVHTVRQMPAQSPEQATGCRT